ncbi:MAG TPA: NAD-dependent epimerase/dehydratase family protein, partial [Tepidisphaeraceae bacterium]|nr:NAD-dependent epimerase/dehydratase family protein [Tepidisphaeraceae bacterium]
MQIDWKKLHGEAFNGIGCAVTGGAGFIGSHLVDALVALGADVTVIDDLSSGFRENVNPKAKLIEASVLDESIVKSALVGKKFVFHQAAKVSVPASVNDPAGYHRVNVDGTMYLLEAARKANVKRVMFAASSSAYGDSDELPKHENMPPLSKSPYAANKVAGEHLMRAYANSFEIDAVSLRYFNIFGPRQAANSPYSGVIAKFVTMLMKGERPTITGDGSATRDFTFVANAVHANLLAARHQERLNGEVFNVATGIRTSVLELALALARLVGRADLSPTFAPVRPGDVAHSQADLSRTSRMFGFKPIVDFE